MKRIYRPISYKGHFIYSLFDSEKEVFEVQVYAKIIPVKSLHAAKLRITKEIQQGPLEYLHTISGDQK